MSIRDIIEAATPGPWRHSSGAFVDAVVNDEIGTNQPVAAVLESAQFGEPMPYHQNARFIASFDPEHVALMEAVCEAAEDVADEVTNGVPLGDNVVEFMDEDSDYLFIEKSLIRKLDDALERRAAYRKERGL